MILSRAEFLKLSSLLTAGLVSGVGLKPRTLTEEYEKIFYLWDNALYMNTANQWVEINGQRYSAPLMLSQSGEHLDPVTPFMQYQMGMSALYGIKSVNKFMPGMRGVADFDPNGRVEDHRLVITRYYFLRTVHPDNGLPMTVERMAGFVAPKKGLVSLPAFNSSDYD